MHPTIDGTQFGSISVDGGVFDHDIVIRLSGKVKKRKKKLSKQKFGTSHAVSLEGAESIFDWHRGSLHSPLQSSQAAEESGVFRYPMFVQGGKFGQAAAAVGRGLQRREVLGLTPVLIEDTNE